MEEIATRAGMRAGNLYRYFPSEAALILCLVERAQAEIEDAFCAVRSVDEFHDALEGMLRDHLSEEARGRAAVLVEMWAEACRTMRFTGSVEPARSASARGFEVFSPARRIFQATP